MFSFFRTCNRHVHETVSIWNLKHFKMHFSQYMRQNHTCNTVAVQRRTRGYYSCEKKKQVPAEPPSHSSGGGASPPPVTGDRCLAPPLRCALLHATHSLCASPRYRAVLPQASNGAALPPLFIPSPPPATAPTYAHRSSRARPWKPQLPPGQANMNW